MKKFIITTIVILITQCTYASTYISPEQYAVNEADFMDYTKIAPPRKIDIDTLEDDRFKAGNLVEADFNIGKEETKKDSLNNKNTNEAYKKRLSYKFAKWWVDQRYKREEPHHGTLHEIKVNKRIEYEKHQEEIKNENKTE